MAERRMFAKAVINSARFLRMPPSSRLLYYDLGMAADDDGIVEAFTVMRTTGATEDDLRVLAAKGFIAVLNDDLVSFIVDWKRNNLIKKDRYHESIYAHLLVQIQDGTQAEPIGIQTESDGTQAEPEWNPDGTQVEPEVRKGKSNLGYSRLIEDKTREESPSIPTVEDVRLYMCAYAQEKGLEINAALSADRFWNYSNQRNWNIRDWMLYAREWVDKDAQRRTQRPNPALAYDQRDSTDYSGNIIDLSEYADDE